MTFVVLAIDPGPTESGCVIWDADRGAVQTAAIAPNGDVIGAVRRNMLGLDLLLIEDLECYGMPAGRELFQTARWSGRFEQAALPTPTQYITRRQVKLALCGNSRAKDPNIRAALLDRYGGSSARGTKKNRGPLYGITGHLWSALALIETWKQNQPQGVAT